MRSTPLFNRDARKLAPASMLGLTLLAALEYPDSQRAREKPDDPAGIDQMAGWLTASLDKSVIREIEA